MPRITLPLAPSRPNGAVVYRGPSQLDGAEIVLVVVGLRDGSTNGKTGDMVQTYVLRADCSPVEALLDGRDESVCGDCLHRKVNGAGSCYVNVGQAPLTVWRALQAGSYPVLDPAAVSPLLAGRLLRCGSYGDPVAVPVEVWRALLAETAGHTGYTHQWRRGIARAYRQFLMASCDTARQALLARKRGWRYFRVTDGEDETLPREIVCPASEEAGKRLSCAECGACAGSGNNAVRASVRIRVHGLDHKSKRFRQALRLRRQKKRFRSQDWQLSRGRFVRCAT